MQKHEKAKKNFEEQMEGLFSQQMQLLFIDKSYVSVVKNNRAKHWCNFQIIAQRRKSSNPTIRFFAESVMTEVVAPINRSTPENCTKEKYEEASKFLSFTE